MNLGAGRIWRKLRRLGAGQVLDGLAALPLDARNEQQSGSPMRLSRPADDDLGRRTGLGGAERGLLRMAETVASARALIDHAARA
jgi:hypothetical protein